MKIDVVIVAFRSEPTIAACLASLPPEVRDRVVVVDNAATDGAAALADAFGARVLRNTANVGFGVAANQGARLGSGDAVLFLNPDAELTPGALTAMLERFSDPEVAVVGASLMSGDGSEQQARWRYPTPRNMWLEALGLTGGRKAPSTGFVVGACFLIRRSVFDALGGFDERFWLYGEEADLCFRVEQAGSRIALATEARVLHIGGASGRESPDMVFSHFAAGSDRFVLTHSGRAGLLSYRIAALVGSAVRLAVFSIVKRSDPRRAVRARHLRNVCDSLLHHPLSVNVGGDRGPQHDLVVVSLEPWDEVWRRNQLIVGELLQMQPSLRVLWIEPPHDVLHDARRTRRLGRIRAQRPRQVPGYPRVTLVQPRKLLPRAIWPFVDRSLIAQVRRAMRTSGVIDPVLWINDNNYVGLAEPSSGRVVYDITDDWLDSTLAPRHLARVTRNDQALMEMADEVIVCSPELERRRGSSRTVRLIPNAVDIGHFQTPQTRPADLPASPVAVYVGSLHDDRIDVELLARCAAQFPETAFILVGPDALSEQSQSRLATHDNVHRIGPRPYAQVPGYLQHADVVIVPHLVSPFTESLDPIKAYECVAVGRPTLATPVAGFRDLDLPVEVCDRDQFPSRLASLLDAPIPSSPRPVPSWRERAVDFADALDPAAPSAAPARHLTVAYVGHTAAWSGGELALANLLDATTEVDALVVLGEDGPIVERFTAAGARVQILAMNESARSVSRDRVVAGRLPWAAAVETLRYIRRLARFLRAEQPDIVHTNTLKAALYGGLAGRLAGVPVVWHIRDRLSPDYLPRAAIVIYRCLARWVPHAIVVNSAATRATLGRSAKRAQVIFDSVAPVAPTADPQVRTSCCAPLPPSSPAWTLVP
jgi:teichuronic acid biosynthesis glycosyltransferase TuaH